MHDIATRTRPVLVALTLKEAEQLLHFIAKRQGLWCGECAQYGIDNADSIPFLLAAAYQKALVDTAMAAPDEQERPL